MIVDFSVVSLIFSSLAESIAELFFTSLAVSYIVTFLRGTI